MSKLEKLIEKLCPDGVEYRRLKELCNTITTGKLNANAMIEDGKYPFFTCDSKPSKINEYAFDTEAILISGNGSQVGHINYYNGKFNAYQRTYVLYDFNGIEVKYLLHYLGAYLKEYILINSKKGSVPYITLPILQNFRVPVPPIEVQNEIVTILDNFTKLKIELEVELETRKKQYEYYFYKLMKSNNYKKKKLSEIGKVRMCKRILKNQTKSMGDIPFYKIGTFGKQADAYINKKTFEELKNRYAYPKEGDVLISCSGTIGRTVVFDGKPAYFQDSNIVWLEHDETIIFNKFLKYCYMTKPWKVATGGTIARLYNDNILNVEIPIPSLEEQEKIVSILDRFDKLCNDTSEGLPAEIEARRKQYEYYRDKLLNFKELIEENKE